MVGNFHGTAMEDESASASYAYDTLAPLEYSNEASPDDASASYFVLRSQITSTVDLAVDIPVSDYLSLDVSSNSPCGDLEESHPVASAATSTATAERLLETVRPASESSWFRSGSRFKSPMLQLHKEVLDFSEFISPTPKEQEKRNAAVSCVFEVVKYIWPQCRVEVFGSFRTGLYLPTSDIDVVILNSKVKTPQTGLYALARALSQKGIAKKMQVLAKARVPIVKFIEKQSEVAFDISVIQNVVEKIPPLRPLCLILKVFLQQRELNEVYSGGIGSYALLAMLLAHLQVHWRSLDTQGVKKKLEHNLGILLVKFFEFYGRKLNTSDVGVSCNSSRTFFLKSDKGFLNSERPYLLAIEDPQVPDNDIGRNSYNYYKVRSAFAMAYSSLTDARVIMSLGPDKSILGTIIRPDPVLLDRKGGSKGELTFKSLLPGAGEKSIPVPIGFENDIIFNWQLVDDEPLPRDNKLVEHASSSSRKRRDPREIHNTDKLYSVGSVVNGKDYSNLRESNAAKKKRILDRADCVQNHVRQHLR
ncbi:DNA polymerase sigma subunit [Apostasia shenzhenica]|uniref:polynucleotide adenylyltransferase n=1 Tax=Apostasia shenzhenica TaxID=1088818 RepID=A0A2H9ZV91_9ASPA|nr:DNA polymerase sigma subunit [Apostasia shenzhenica]